MVFIPSSKYGTIFSFMYTRAGAPPGRTWLVVVGAEPLGSAVGVFAAALLGVDAVPMASVFAVSLSTGFEGIDVLSIGCADGFAAAAVVGGREAEGASLVALGTGD